jgi:hypothetical protein
MVLGEEAGSKAIDVLRSHSGSQYLQIYQAADLFLRYGLIFIMFHIGLGTYVISQLRSLDSDSLKVAVIGAFTPMVLGFMVFLVLASGISHVGHIFIAATLGTTGFAVTSGVFSLLH